MNISLTPEMDNWIVQKVKSGMYKSSSGVIREGLRLLQFRDEQRLRMVEDLRTELMKGVTQLDTGNSVKFDHKLVKKVKQDARKSLC